MVRNAPFSPLLAGLCQKSGNPIAAERLIPDLTSVVTWISCYQVFVLGGWTFGKFLRRNLYYLDQSMKCGMH